jgi:hypothetical protein
VDVPEHGRPSAAEESRQHVGLDAVGVDRVGPDLPEPALQLCRIVQDCRSHGNGPPCQCQRTQPPAAAEAAVAQGCDLLGHRQEPRVNSKRLRGIDQGPGGSGYQVQLDRRIGLPNGLHHGQQAAFRTAQDADRVEVDHLHGVGTAPMGTTLPASF